jgi:hypothetical protein
MREIILYANEGEQKGPKRGGAESSRLLIGASGGGPIPFISLSASRLIASCNYRLSLLFSSAQKFAARQFGRRNFAPSARCGQDKIICVARSQLNLVPVCEMRKVYFITLGTHVTQISQNTVIVFWRNLNFPKHKVTAAIEHRT